MSLAQTSIPVVCRSVKFWIVVAEMLELNFDVRVTLHSLLLFRYILTCQYLSFVFVTCLKFAYSSI